MDKKSSIFGTIAEKLKKNKSLEIGVYVVLGALALIIYLSTLGSGNAGGKTENDTSATVTGTVMAGETAYESEKKLAQVLSTIRGAGKVSVMITYDTGTQIVPAMSESVMRSTSSGESVSSSDKTESKAPATVSQSGSEVPIVLTEILPTVRGVIVIAEGAADISVRLNLMHAVKTVLGVDESCIEVFEMQTEG